MDKYQCPYCGCTYTLSPGEVVHYLGQAWHIQPSSRFNWTISFDTAEICNKLKCIKCGTSIGDHLVVQILNSLLESN